MPFQLPGETLLRTQAAEALERLRQPGDVDEVDALLRDLLNGITPEEFLLLVANREAALRPQDEAEPEDLWLLQSLARGLAILVRRSSRCANEACELLLRLSESPDEDLSLAAVDALRTLPSNDRIRARFRVLLGSPDTLVRHLAAQALKCSASA